MGGTLAAIHAAAHPDSFASLVALAAPVRFEDAGLLGAWTRSARFEPKALVEALGNVPWQLLQASFHMLRPTLTASKLVHMVDRAYDDEFLDGFFALETWGNDNVSFPGECWKTWVEELYRRDAFAQGTFALSGKCVAMRDVSCPLLVVTFEHDSIVPKTTAAPLLEQASSKDKHGLHLPGGHVGAVVSRAASKRLWPQLSEFWAARDGAPALSASGAPRATPTRRRARRASARESASRP
jgi:polyhydroxyalkanoate synthase